MAAILQLHPEHPQKRHVDRVVEALHRGGVIVYPTDTVYGLGCDIFNRKAINRIYQIKQAPAGKPLSFVCSDLKDLARYAKNISNAAYRMMKTAPRPLHLHSGSFERRAEVHDRQAANGGHSGAGQSHSSRSCRRSAGPC